MPGISEAIPPYLRWLGCALFWLWSRFTPKKHPALPPGPPADPLIGHLRLIPSRRPETLFYEWGKVYGNVMYLHVLGRPIIVLNSVEAAVDLLDKRSANYSDRPGFALYKLMGWGRNVTFMGYGKRFQKHRKLLQNYLNANKCITYQPIQTREAHVFLQNILSEEAKWDNFIQRFSTAIVTRIAYGHQVIADDPYVHITEGASYAFNNSGPPGNTPVDFFPILRYFPSWFPGAYYAGFARDNKLSIDTLHQYPFERVKKNMIEGKARSSFLSDQLESLYLEGAIGSDDVLDIQGAAGVMYCAGADTTWSTASFLFLAMLLHPESQAQAHEEIDAVIGSGRLPEFCDRSSLPYLECVLQETMRLYAAVPLVPQGFHIVHWMMTYTEECSFLRDPS